MFEKRTIPRLPIIYLMLALVSAGISVWLIREWYGNYHRVFPPSEIPQEITSLPEQRPFSYSGLAYFDGRLYATCNLAGC